MRPEAIFALMGVFMGFETLILVSLISALKRAHREVMARESVTVELINFIGSHIGEHNMSRIMDKYKHHQLKQMAESKCDCPNCLMAREEVQKGMDH